MSGAGEPIPLDPTKLVVATLSEPGRVRPENQDAAAVLGNVSNERLFVVADGMGGQRGGEIASKLCIDTLARSFRDPHGTPQERLRRGLELANEEVYGHALSKPELKGMGTTAVALLVGSGTRGVWLTWVGDSRCYRLRAGALELLTKDHSLIAEWIAMGVIRPEEAENHPRRHELTRAIGQSPDVVVEVVRVDVQAGDRFLLCSDGVHALVPDRALKAALALPVEEAARVLIDRANANGGSDNATVVIAEIPEAAVTSAAIEQPPEVPLELELPSPPPPPAPAAPEPDLSAESLEIEATAHSSVAIDAALAELEAARARGGLAADLNPSPPDSPLPQRFEAPAADLSAESSFADLMDDEPGDSPTPTPVPSAPPAVELGARLGPLLGGPSLDSPSLVAPPPARQVRIPLMTPVRARRGLHAPSVLTGLALGALVAAAAAGAWLYTAMSPSGAGQTHPPFAGTRHAAPPVTRPPARSREAPPAPVARAEIPPPVPAPAAAPAEEAPAPEVTRAEPPPAPAPATPETPTAPAAPPASAVTPTAPAQVPSPAAPPTPIAMPDAPRPAPTTVVIVRPQTAPPPPTLPAAPDGSPVAPLPTAEGFELTPPVRRFVDDWLRAQETHDSRLFASLGFPGLPTELAGTWATRDSYRLKAASIDEERSTGDWVYLRLVVSYAFRDGSGRFRTEDEERMILHASGGKLQFEGRWQQ